MNKLTAVALWMALATTVGATEYTVHGIGRVMYEKGGQTLPVPKIRVRLMDSDFDLDDELAQGYTDEKGNFDLTGKGNDWCVGDCVTPDPYIQIVTQRDDWVDVNTLIGASHRYHTKVYEETIGLIKFGNNIQIDSPESGLWVEASNAHQFFKDNVGGHLPEGGFGGLPMGQREIVVTYPAIIDNDTPYTLYMRIMIPEQSGSSSIAHESGHRLRHPACGPFEHWLGDAIAYEYPKNHSRGKTTNEGFAFNEGWAWYYKDVVKDTINKWSLADHPDGDKVEGNVEYKLMRLSRSCGGFKNLWSVLVGSPGKIHSWSAFEAAFMKKFPACKVKPLEIDRAIADAVDLLPHPSPMAISSSAAHRFANALDQSAKAYQIHWKPKGLGAALKKLSPPAQAVVTGVQQRRLTAVKAWDVSARAAMRKHLLALPVATQKTITDGSYEKQLRATRAAFLAEVAEPRLKQIADLKKHVAAERAKAGDANLQKHLDGLTARYTTAETRLRDALANRDKLTRIPDDVLPPSFARPATSR